MDEPRYLIPPQAPTLLPIEALLSDELEEMSGVEIDFCSNNSGQPAKE